MVTLLNDDLFIYLEHMQGEIDKRISGCPEGSLPSLMHSQMRDIVIAERDFLRYINTNGTQPILSISPNGLPSTNSLNPDLEKICELSEDEKSFLPISQRYKKGIGGKNKGEEGHMYVPVSEEEWSKELVNRGNEKLQSQIGFSVSETEDGRFQLALREDIYLQGYDQHSKDFPVLIREGKMKYHVVWNRLLDEPEESFYVPNTALVLQGRPIKPSILQFKDVKRFYDFRNSDFNGVKKPWLLKLRGNSIDYAAFLSAGTNARVRTTENILGAIGRALERQVIIKGIRKNDLGQTLAFADIPFKNAPRTTPEEEDLYENISGGYGNFERRIPKHQTRFDLVFTTGGDKMGQIEYVLPYNERIWSPFRKHDFTKGGISLTVLGESVCNEEQYHNLQNELRRVRKSYYID